MKNQENAMISMATLNEIVRRCGDNIPEYCCILDFEKRGYLFVAEQYLPHWGWTREELLRTGWEHYKHETHPDDVQLFDSMRQTVMERIGELGERVSDVAYFSLHYKLRFPHKGATDFLMVHLKMAPIILDGKVRYGAVMVSASIINTSGHLRTYFKDTDEYEEYDFVSNKWVKGCLPRLYLQEQHILTLTRMGYDIKSISDKMNLSATTIRNIMVKMYKKLNVNSITQAVLFAMDHRMLYYPSEDRPMRQTRKKILAKNKLTTEMLEQIQLAWNQGKSINAIAKTFDVQEGSIRHAIRKGRLIPPPFLQKEQKPPNT